MIPDIHKLHTDLDNNTSLFLDILDTIPADKLQKKNEQTEWSIMECAEHTLMIEQEVANVLQGHSAPVKDRAPNSKVEEIRHTFLEFNNRLQVTGDPLTPKTTAITIRGAYKDKDAAAFGQDFRHNREIIKATLEKEKERVDWLCKGIEHSTFGFMTRIEWVYYIIYHTERHLQQINRIEASLENIN